MIPPTPPCGATTTGTPTTITTHSNNGSRGLVQALLMMAAVMMTTLLHIETIAVNVFVPGRHVVQIQTVKVARRQSGRLRRRSDLTRKAPKVHDCFVRLLF
jgi:hypothetical protein